MHNQCIVIDQLEFSFVKPPIDKEFILCINDLHIIADEKEKEKQFISIEN